MTRLFDPSLSRALVGFDRLFDNFESTFGGQLASNYPPYNVYSDGDNNYAIEIAVAGFRKEEISVEVSGDRLTVKAEHQTEDKAPKYLYRGLSARSFVRSFVLAEHVEVKGVVLQNGILRVDLERVIPEAKKPKLIDITEVK